jgi:hypothetical protein
VKAAKNTYAAIAYSRSTGKYGFTYQQPTLEAAKADALRRCEGNDARIVVWTRNGWCALAKGADGTFGAASAPSQQEAEKDALGDCAKKTSGQAQVAIAIRSAYEG